MSRVTLRPITEQDLDVFACLFSDPQVMAYSEGRLSKPQVSDWIESVKAQYQRQDGFGCYAITLERYAITLERHANNAFICPSLIGQRSFPKIDPNTRIVAGYCSLQRSSYTQQPELGYRLLPQFWRQGLAFEAVILLLEQGFRELGFTEISAQIDPHNRRSQALAKRLGMSVSREIQPDGYDYPDQIWTLSHAQYQVLMAANADSSNYIERQKSKG